MAEAECISVPLVGRVCEGQPAEGASAYGNPSEKAKGYEIRKDSSYWRCNHDELIKNIEIKVNK